MATATVASDLAKLLADGENTIIKGWLDSLQRNSDARISAQEVESQARDLLRGADAGGSVGRRHRHRRPRLPGGAGHPRRFLAQPRAAGLLADGDRDLRLLDEGAAVRADPLQSRKAPRRSAEQTWALTRLLDKLGLFTIEAFQRTREELIARQREEIEELSTPVVKLWDGVLALPLIGTLDSARTQVVMENLLESIVETGAEIAIIDITGVPTVDTLVAQHLLKTVAAARLMGADCIISGIRPQIAQTIVQLGVQLNVVSKATLADAFAMALTRTGRRVVKVRAQARTKDAAGRRVRSTPWTAFPSSRSARRCWSRSRSTCTTSSPLSCRKT